LFQALATGHGGLCTMHADDVETVIKRLTQPPMNIPQNILSLMNCVIVVKQVRTSGLNRGKKMSGRKFVTVSEIDNNGLPSEVFAWNMKSDTFKQSIDTSYLFGKIAKSQDVPISVVHQEFARRRQILLNMVEKNLRDFKSVHKALNSSINTINLSETSEED
jgi:flagellar protein FlaI